MSDQVISDRERICVPDLFDPDIYIGDRIFTSATEYVYRILMGFCFHQSRLLISRRRNTTAAEEDCCNAKKRYRIIDPDFNFCIIDLDFNWNLSSDSISVDYIIINSINVECMTIQLLQPDKHEHVRQARLSFCRF
ncbi:hypothetical protein L2E82_16315 [Cichorium intybus]|uniref:Uncharacterized protein n=1 Tax=Cichorium intybus TaxID=13427 RepID=A0ACB9F572_CICIN|nr:hypothetical protein L2E82_16315 [Cichorium intybus]